MKGHVQRGVTISGKLRVELGRSNPFVTHSLTLIMMFKALLALALTVNLAASLTCYSGTQVIASGCGGGSMNDIASTDADTYAALFGLPAGSYDTCMSYTYSGSAGRSCTHTQVVSTLTSSARLAAMGCDYYETSVETQTAAAGMTVTDGTWTCTTCTTDDCNQDATEVTTSGAGSLYASRTLACLSSFAVALLLCRLF